MIRPLHSWLTDCPAGDPRVIARGSDTVWTAGEFRDTVLCLHQALRERPETRWALIGSCPARTAAGLLALLHAGKTVILPPNSLPGTLRDLDPWMDGVLTDTELTEEPAVRMDLQRQAADGHGLPLPPELDPETAVVEFFTSGSTGSPKRISKVLRQLEVEVHGLEDLWGDRAGDLPVFATVSHQHIYGLLFRVLWPLCAGRVFRLTTQAYPEHLLQAMQADGPGLLVSSPAQLDVMPDLISLTDLARVCPLVFSSGGPLPPATALRFQQGFGTSPVEVLGSTETGGVAWRQRGDRNPEGYWTPVPAVQCVVSDEDAPLRIRSPYLPDPDALFTMDDRARAVGDGRFALLCRGDRVVKISEKRVSLDDVEALLHQHPWVQSCAVALVKQDSISRRTVLGAAVVLTDAGRFEQMTRGRRDLNQTLTQALTDHLEPVARPRRWRYLDSLPVNAQGKRVLADLQAVLETPPSEGAPRLPVVTSVDREPGRVSLHIQVPADLVYLQDHFPGMPVVPGVVLIDWVASFGGAAFSCGDAVESMNRVKFQQVMLPGLETDLTLTWNPDNGRLNFTFGDADLVYASGTLQMPSQVEVPA